MAKKMSVNKKAVSTPSWADQVTRFSAHLDTIERSGKTILAYQGDLNRFSSWYHAINGEPPALAGITGTDLLEWKRDMVERELRPPTINRALAAVKTFLRWGHREGVDVPRRVRKSPDLLKWLDRSEQLRLQRVVERSGNKRDLAIVRILLHTGLRVAELVALCWQDVDWTSPRKGELTVRYGKGAKWRVIPLHVVAREAFAVLAEAAEGAEPRDRVFMGPKGPIGTRAVVHLLAKYAGAAKIKKLTPHMLRHTFCKNLIDAGVGLPEVARMAGHESILTTQRYVTPSAGDLERAIEKLGGGTDEG